MSMSNRKSGISAKTGGTASAQNLNDRETVCRFIRNEGEFFTADYLSDSFEKKVLENSFFGTAKNGNTGSGAEALVSENGNITEDSALQSFENTGNSDGTGDSAFRNTESATPSDRDSLSRLLGSKITELRDAYKGYREILSKCIERNNIGDIIGETSNFHGQLLGILGYDSSVIRGSLSPDGRPVPYSEIYYLNGDEDPEKAIVPVRHIIHRDDGSVRMLIMEMQPVCEEERYTTGNLFEQKLEDEQGSDPRTIPPQRYFRTQWKNVFKVPEGYHVSPSVISDAISEIFHGKKELRPECILLLAGPEIYFIRENEWNRQSYLVFSIEEMFAAMTLTGKKENFQVFWLFLSAPELLRDFGLVSRLLEDNRNNTYSVTSELKHGVVEVIKLLGNEFRTCAAEQGLDVFPKETASEAEKEEFNRGIINDCLVYVYRLLFIFFAESRNELGLVPGKDSVYERGYSLSNLRRLAMRRLTSRADRNGFFIDESFKKTCELYIKGSAAIIRENDYQVVSEYGTGTEWLRRVDSPIFSDKCLKYFGDLKIRNFVWQEIIKHLSVTRRGEGKNRRTGMISYAALGVNQLGAVYENLMSYRGYYAEEDLITVHKKGEKDNSDNCLLDRYSRMGEYDLKNEVVHEPDNSEAPARIPRGSFVYWLSSLDRSRTASFYTPESLTQSTVKFILQGFEERLRTGEMMYPELLDLRILEISTPNLIPSLVA